MDAYALCLAGPVEHDGKVETAHLRVSQELAQYLLTHRGFRTATVVTAALDVRAAMDGLFQRLREPGQLGVLSYVGHGLRTSGQSSWQFGGVTSRDLETYISTVHPSSMLVLISDSCFSDGMARPESRPLVFYSAAREEGPGSLALYTTAGGVLSTGLLRALRWLPGWPTYQQLAEHIPGVRLLCYPSTLASQAAFVSPSR